MAWGRDMKKQIRVLIAHQDPVVSNRLRRIFHRQEDLVLMSPVKTKIEPVKAIGRRRPRVLLLDTRFVQANSFGFLARLRQCSPATQVLLLDKQYRSGQEVKAARMGARGYIGGPVEPATLRKAVQVIEAGEIWMRRKTMARVLDEFLTLLSPA